MRAFRWLCNLGALALAVYLLGATRYGSFEPCRAAATAIRAEAPAIMDIVAGRDSRFSMFKKTGPISGVMRALALQSVDKSIAAHENEMTVWDCVGVVAYRELDPEGFRRAAAELVLQSM